MTTPNLCHDPVESVTHFICFESGLPRSRSHTMHSRRTNLSNGNLSPSLMNLREASSYTETIQHPFAWCEETRNPDQICKLWKENCATYYSPLIHLHGCTLHMSGWPFKFPWTLNIMMLSALLLIHACLMPMHQAYLIAPVMHKLWCLCYLTTNDNWERCFQEYCCVVLMSFGPRQVPD